MNIHPLSSTGSSELSSTINAEFVIFRLEEAGATLLALPNTGFSTRLRVGRLDVVQEKADAQEESGRCGRAAAVDAARITRMDEALQWIGLIPTDRYVLKRVVGARSLVNPVTARHLYSWRRLGQAVGADHKAVQRWHAQGIGLVVAGLTSGSRCKAIPQRTSVAALFSFAPRPG